MIAVDCNHQALSQLARLSDHYGNAPTFSMITLAAIFARRMPGSAARPDARLSH
jgi:hypothetical protein